MSGKRARLLRKQFGIDEAYARMKRAWTTMSHWQRKVWTVAERKARG